MPKLLRARPPLDAWEEHQVRTLATSTHAPAEWLFHAKLVVRSWDGQRTSAIALALDCHPQPVRERLYAFNARGLDGLGMRPGSGRPPRLTEGERSARIALVHTPPPGTLMPAPDSGAVQARDETREPGWTLDRLTAAAQAQGIQVGRSQLRCILLRDGVRWRRTRLWAASQDPDFAPQSPTRTQ